MEPPRALARAHCRDRIASAGAVLLLELLLGYALIAGLGVRLPERARETIAVFELAPPPPMKPRAERTVPKARPHPQGAAAPPNLRARRTEVVAPVPVVPPAVPPPLVVAPVAGTGARAEAGAAERPGPGSGAGGIGDGTGSGGAGDGDGGGGRHTPPRWRSGRLKASDLPRQVVEAGVGGTVWVRYAVQPDGRATDCIVTRSSGDPLLDETTCRLIERRFRYDPSRDEYGRPVRSQIVEYQDWVIEPEPPAPRG